MNPLTQGDRLWERLKAGHPWLQKFDAADWHTWIHHTLITVALGALIGWALPFVSIAFGMRFMVGVYFVREVINVRERRLTGQPLKPLDHVMDVGLPLLVVETLIRL